MGWTKLDEGESTPTLGAQNTASVNIPANVLGLVIVTLRAATAPGSNVVSMTSSHGTWVRGVERTITSGANRLVAVFRTMGAGATAVIAIQGPTDTLGMTWTVVTRDGTVTTGSSGAGAVNNASPLDSNNGTVDANGQPTVTITGTPSAGDETFGVFGGDDAESGLTEEGGWTLITEFIGTLETSHSVMYSTGQDQSASWTGVRSGRAWGAIGAIIKIAGAAVPDQWYPTYPGPRVEPTRVVASGFLPRPGGP